MSRELPVTDPAPTPGSAMPMSPRERFLRSCLGGAVDRFFRYEHGAWPSTWEAWQAQGLPPEADFARYFDLDPMVRLPVRSGYTDSPLWPPIESRVLEESATWVILRDTDGIVKKLLKAHPDTSMPQFLRFPVENRADWTAMLPHLDPANVPDLLGDLDGLREQLEPPGGAAQRDYPVTLTACGAFGHPRNLLGYERLAFTLYDDPGLMRDIVANWLALYKRILDEVGSRIAVDCFLIWEDMCFKNGPLISPKHFREFLLRPYGELVDHARRCGVQSVWVDTDGNMVGLIPLFLEAGVDTLMPFEVQAGMDIVSIRQRFGDAFTIVGGIDKRVLAMDRESIRREVERVVPFFRESGRYIPCLDHTVPTDVPLSSFRYYLECLRSYEPR